MAETEEARRTGLMHRRHLDADHGMLFAYPHARLVHMWMKDTHIALDMLFLSDAPHPIIRHIHHHARPHDRTPISSRYPVRYILEIPSGNAKNHGFSVGDHVTIDCDE
ncbi:MAG: DUF192 domain-containing protein [Sphaerospermopsis sp. SIO1G2]|nr:DUF192 domain-containing protein [Sphaerospermopsis sp. SIO1G2]